MATVVKEMPRKTRAPKYPDMPKWLDGRIHRLVRGEDFDIEEGSFKTLLYTLAPKKFNSRVKIQWETERGQRVAYVQALPLKDSKPKKA
jgi:hypothetical protein